MSRRVLVTGPAGRTEDYAEAARTSGWEPLVTELIRIEECGLQSEIPTWVDLVCVTSKHALGTLRKLAEKLRSVPVAVVGERTAAAVREIGYTVEHGPTRTAAELGSQLVSALSPGAVVLWPRGSVSDDLAKLLRISGIDVHDPVVYRTLPIESPDPPPAADAVLLTSPSAVYAYAVRVSPGDHGTAIAIGPTTAAAIRDSELQFSAVLPLERPTPRAFAQCLEDLAT